jgi:hypothetical protein
MPTATPPAASRSPVVCADTPPVGTSSRHTPIPGSSAGADRGACPCFPGALSPTEIHAAWSAGASAVKPLPVAAVGVGCLMSTSAMRARMTPGAGLPQRHGLARSRGRARCWPRPPWPRAGRPRSGRIHTGGSTPPAASTGRLGVADALGDGRDGCVGGWSGEREAHCEVGRRCGGLRVASVEGQRPCPSSRQRPCHFGLGPA